MFTFFKGTLDSLSEEVEDVSAKPWLEPPHSFLARFFSLLSILRKLGAAAPTRRSEHLLRGVGDVEEAVCISVVGINVSHAGGHARHALLCHQEEEGLGGVQINLVPDSSRCKRGERDVDKDMPARMGANHLPEQTQELTQGELVGNQELCLVQQGEALFTEVAFNNYLKTETQDCAVSKLTDGFTFKTRKLTGNLFGNLERMLHTSSFLVSRKTHIFFLNTKDVNTAMC